MTPFEADTTRLGDSTTAPAVCGAGNFCVPQIVAHPEVPMVTVGDVEFREPRLLRVPEIDFSLKCEIAGDAPWHLLQRATSTSDDMWGGGEKLIGNGLKPIHDYYAACLGPAFNRRFQAANYQAWIAPHFDQTTANMLRLRGNKLWRQYNGNLVRRAHDALPWVQEAERDGLHNLIPAIVTWKASPHAIKRKIGKGAWKRIAAMSRTRTMKIMQAVFAGKVGSDCQCETRFLRLIDAPSSLLPFMYGQDEKEVLAARLSPKKTHDAFSYTTSIIRDCRRMLGSAFNPAWSLTRMVKEHDAAAHALAAKKYSAKPFASEWRLETDDYTAERLVSPAAIAAEGLTQHHCVASYIRNASANNYAVVKISGAERATLGANWIGKWSIDQCYGPCNGPVDPETKAFAQKVIDAMNGPTHGFAGAGRGWAALDEEEMPF